MHIICSTESRNIIGTEILGINKTLQTDKWTFCFNGSICACNLYRKKKKDFDIFNERKLGKKQ
jgi:hypothetical protein